MADRLDDPAYHLVRCRGTKRDFGIADRDADCVHMTRIAQIARTARNGLSHPADFIGRNRCGQSRIGWEDGDNVGESS